MIKDKPNKDIAEEENWDDENEELGCTDCTGCLSYFEPDEIELEAASADVMTILKQLDSEAIELLLK
jgi:hypothetical protein